MNGITLLALQEIDHRATKICVGFVWTSETLLIFLKELLVIVEIATFR